MNKNYVLYHSSCYDGFGSAFAAWKFFGNDKDTVYLPVSYGKEPPAEIAKTGAHIIYILDFSYNEEQLVELSKSAKHIILIDHHKTAQDKLAHLEGKYPWLKITFDMKKSGALLAWEHFHGNLSPVPELIKHISDRDLWQFKMKGTEEVHKALVSYPMDFKVWDKFEVEHLKKEGVALKRMYDNLVENICKSAWLKDINGHMVPVVNTSIAWSEVGNRLLELNPQVSFAASFTVFKDQVMWSLRSRKDFDVSEIAKKFGGGGHPQAAGFKTQRF